MINAEWQKGAPDKLVAGMVVRIDAIEGVHLVGSGSLAAMFAIPIGASITEWAWLIKPYQLEWVGNKCKI